MGGKPMTNNYDWDYECSECGQGFNGDPAYGPISPDEHVRLVMSGKTEDEIRGALAKYGSDRQYYRCPTCQANFEDED
jgi:DNA-directed RNA polymerase subunit RPC12/RpoP